MISTQNIKRLTKLSRKVASAKDEYDEECAGLPSCATYQERKEEYKRALKQIAGQEEGSAATLRGFIDGVAGAVSAGLVQGKLFGDD